MTYKNLSTRDAFVINLFQIKRVMLLVMFMNGKSLILRCEIKAAWM
jgi:hypothetical protein